ncbi:MAG: membrane protein insertion efficiency factor YidD, partial [Pirellulaceae bacterium]
MRRLPAALAIAAIRFYQRGISPLLGPRCKFHPTCSQYCLEAIAKYGLISGLLRGLYRLARCHPWSCGGYD